MLLFNPEIPEEYEACKRVSYAMGHRAMELGGTCTGEHGIGKLYIGCDSKKKCQNSHENSI